MRKYHYSPMQSPRPEMPLSGFRLALIAQNSPVHHLLGLSIFAARLIRSYMGYVPIMPSIQLSSSVHHLLGLSIFAARLIRSYMGYVPIMPSIQLSSCMRELDPLTYFPAGRVVLVYTFPMFSKKFFNFWSSLTLR